MSKYKTFTNERSNFDSLYSVEMVKEGVYLCRELYYDSWNRANIWVLPGSERNLVIDTGIGVYNLREFLGQQKIFNGLQFTAVATHIHFDHTGGLQYFDDFGIHELDTNFFINGDNYVACSLLAKWEITHPPVKNWHPRMYSVKAGQPTKTLKHNDIIDIGNRSFKVVHLPGHTPGSIGILEERTGYFFSGDVAYLGPLADFAPHSNWRDYVQTCQTLKSLSHSVDTVFPGHGDIFSGEKLYEVATKYEQYLPTCCASFVRCFFGCSLKLFLKGRNTSDGCGKCCFYSCCCCCCC